MDKQSTASDKQPLFDSDVDPKRIKNVAGGLRRQGEFESARMLHAYADRLEADEKAMPVAITCDGYDGDRTGCIKSYKPLPMGTNLYSRPAPADAERLAEALRKVQSWPLADEAIDDNLQAEAREVDEALAAYDARCAQAQPPAASVTDEMVERARSAFVQADDGSTGITDAIRAALLAALESRNG